MHARKIRYDEEFIAPRKNRSAPVVEALSPAHGSVVDKDIPSPARALQRQLNDRIDELAVPAYSIDQDKLSGRTSLAIIIAASIMLWGGLVALGWSIF